MQHPVEVFGIVLFSILAVVPVVPVVPAVPAVPVTAGVPGHRLRLLAAHGAARRKASASAAPVVRFHDSFTPSSSAGAPSRVVGSGAWTPA